MKKGIWRLSLCLYAALAASAPAAAQPANLTFEIRDGLVRLDARDASVAQILERWSTVASVTVVNAEAVATTRVTLRLDGVHFREALAIILRDAGGYIATSRPSRSGSGTELDRILIARAAPASPVVRETSVAPRRGATSRAERSDAVAQETALENITADAAGADVVETIEPPARAAEESPSEPQRYGSDGIPARVVPGLTPTQAAALPPRPPGVVRGPQDPPIVGPQGGKYGSRPQSSPTGPFGARGTSAQPGAVAPAPTPNGSQPRSPATATP